MSWQEAILFGAIGGLMVEVVTLLGALQRWQTRRQNARLRGDTVLPTVAASIDLLPQGFIALTRAILGSFVVLVFHAQILGPPAAVATGMAAPALLIEIGHAVIPRNGQKESQGQQNHGAVSPEYEAALRQEQLAPASNDQAVVEHNDRIS